jgi:hypothetical protein
MSLGAQQPPPPRPPAPPLPVSDSTKRRSAADSVRDATTRDSTAGRDSTRQDSLTHAAAPRRAVADTIKAPTARPLTPRSTEIGRYGWHWDRDAMFASGSLTLGELLAQVPGVTFVTTGFILAPEVVEWYGNPGSVRVFIDGVERDPLNVRNGGVADLTALPLVAFEDVRVERAAGEMRIHLRTWRVERTTPVTRTDVLTGSENLNLYRGFFGTRLTNGGVLQVAGQQSSSGSIGGMDGDGLGAMARVGWAGGRWSVDGTFVRQGLDRSAGARFLTTTPQTNVLPPFKGSEGLAYVRVGWRDPEADGPWLQLIAATINAGESQGTSSLTGGSGTTTSTATKDTVDTTATRSQYVLAAGIARWGLRLSTTSRLRSILGKSYLSPGVRAEYDSRLLTVSAFGERGVDSTTRTDVLARLTPFSWLSVAGAMSRLVPKSASIGPAIVASRLEGGLGAGGRWITGGIVSRGASAITPPVELDSVLRTVTVPAATGIFGGIHGPVCCGFALDVDAIRWSAAASYRPQTQVRSRVWFESSFLKSFPRGTFHVLAAGTQEYRSTMFVPSGTDPFGQSTQAWSSFGTLLEIRIGTAVISWQTRNMVGSNYETYPGYLMPRIVNVYGVRWEFWN